MKKFAKIAMRGSGIGLFTAALTLAFTAWYTSVDYWFPLYVEYIIVGLIAAAACGLTFATEKLIERIMLIRWMTKTYIKTGDGKTEKVKAR